MKTASLEKTYPSRPRAGTHPVVVSTRANLVRPAAEVIGQFVLIFLAALTYFGVRGLTESSPGVAVDHARAVLRFEGWLGLDIEQNLQGAIVGHDWVVTAANWVYIWGHWPVIAATLVWLYRTRRGEYRLLRNAMFVSGAIGLVIFALYPVAPPRLAGLGFVDTVTEFSHSYRVLQPPALVNKYAAVPSLHVGWNFLIGIFIWRHAPDAWMRRLGIVSPVAMFAAVVVTANHYVIDGFAGLAVAGVGLLIAERHDAVRRQKR